MQNLIRSLVAASVAGGVLATASPVFANPRPLPFTYQHEQLPKGESEIEQFVDFSPTRASDGVTAEPIWYGLTNYTTEFETGLTDRLELGLYLTLAPQPSPDRIRFVPEGMESNGIKQRLRYSLAPSGVWPIDVSLYGELSENDHEFEIEAKVLLQRRFGIVRLIANISGEQEIYYNGTKKQPFQDFVANPSLGVTVEASKTIQPGFEAWMRGEWSEYPGSHGQARPFEVGPHVYLGPALLLQFGRLWWSNGVYFRATDPHHTLAPGESYGVVWGRTIIGIGL
jgi:hypothetical protein